MKFCIILAVCAALVLVVSGAAIEGDAPLEAPVVPVELISEDCHQPRETGRCFALFHRYAFNVETRACEEFIYGGCAGNKNNFESLVDCQSKCMTQPEEASSTAEAPKEDGTTTPKN